jgi:hypothetical protein
MRPFQRRPAAESSRRCLERHFAKFSRKTSPLYDAAPALFGCQHRHVLDLGELLQDGENLADRQARYA